MTQMKAMVTSEDRTVVVQDKAVPKASSGEILVKVEAVTLNPTDWKHIKLISEPGVITGCDFAGTVVEVGDGEAATTESGVQKGDQVAGFVHGGKFADVGAFAEYVKADASLVVKVPSDVELTRAASVGIGGYTAAQALFQRLQLALPSPDAQSLPDVTPDSPQVLIWAGSTSVGQWAIQLSRAAGYHVITTASPRNHALLQKMGAAEVHDYRDDTVPDKIRKEHPRLTLALDCISENGTQSLCVRSLSTSAAGKVAVLLKPEKEAKALRDDVQIIHTLIYTCLGHPFAYGQAKFDEAQVTSDREFMLKFTSGEKGLFYQLLSRKLISGNRIKVLGKGFQSVREGLLLLEQGKVSAEKLACTL